MTDLIWLNGEIKPLSDARLGVEDRGFQFADGVYEVIRIYNGRLFALPEHLDRLERSCGGIMMKMLIDRQRLAREIEQFIAKTGVKEGMIYLQITRGDSPRNHAFPQCPQTTLFYARPLPPTAPAGGQSGVKLYSVPDERWKRCWIKSVALLPNVLAKNTALAAGADEAVFVDDGVATECSSSNLFVVRQGALLTTPVGAKVLPGITRLVVLALAKELGIPATERPISEAEAISADELFITSTTREIGWVASWNGKPVSPGRCGAITLKLHKALQERIRRETQSPQR